MIHLAAFMDIETGLGRTIYQDNTVQMSEELIWPMISALDNFVGECTGSDRGLVNASLADIKIYLYAPLRETSPLRFVFFTDLYDNNHYLEIKGQAIFKILSPFIEFAKFDPPPDVLFRVQEIVKYTQIFPIDSIRSLIVEEISRKLENLENLRKLFIADLFIGDIDQGNVFSLINKPELCEKNSVSLFSELLTAFSIDSEIFVKSSLTEEEEKNLNYYGINSTGIIEGWFLQQLVQAKSDFWLVGYFFYQEIEEDLVLSTLKEIGIELSTEIGLQVIKRPF